eukprot:100043-Pyramimonas_sp.AAC.1
MRARLQARLLRSPGQSLLDNLQEESGSEQGPKRMEVDDDAPLAQPSDPSAPSAPQPAGSKGKGRKGAKGKGRKGAGGPGSGGGGGAGDPPEAPDQADQEIPNSISEPRRVREFGQTEEVCCKVEVMVRNIKNASPDSASSITLKVAIGGCALIPQSRVEGSSLWASSWGPLGALFGPFWGLGSLGQSSVAQVCPPRPCAGELKWARVDEGRGQEFAPNSCPPPPRPPPASPTPQAYEALSKKIKSRMTQRLENLYVSDYDAAAGLLGGGGGTGEGWRSPWGASEISGGPWRPSKALGRLRGPSEAFGSLQRPQPSGALESLPSWSFFRRLPGQATEGLLLLEKTQLRDAQLTAVKDLAVALTSNEADGTSVMVALRKAVMEKETNERKTPLIDKDAPAPQGLMLIAIGRNLKAALAVKDWPRVAGIVGCGPVPAAEGESHYAVSVSELKGDTDDLQERYIMTCFCDLL